MSSYASARSTNAIRLGLFLLSVVLITVVDIPDGFAQPSPNGLAVHWRDGTSAAEPKIQVYQYDADTYILRQSIRTSVEAPFLYLIFGRERALLLDTGAGNIPVYQAVQEIIKQWLARNSKTGIPLVVAHSHSHDDHVGGDDQFVDRPNVTVVGRAPTDVAMFFKVESWPEQIVPYELGERTIDLIPAPGHEPAHIVLFDRRTRLLLTGDILYPGRLYFRRKDFELYRRSIDRVAEFAKTRDVAWILGAHIEMSTMPGKDFPWDASSHPSEHRLELPSDRLGELRAGLHQLGSQPKRVVHNDFIIFPID